MSSPLLSQFMLVLKVIIEDHMVSTILLHLLIGIFGPKNRDFLRKKNLLIDFFKSIKMHHLKKPCKSSFLVQIHQNSGHKISKSTTLFCC